MFTKTDQQNIDEYKVFFKNGKNTVEDFFDASFIHDFDVYIHPDRRSLDSAWQKDWKMPDFNSQCWMVASGISHKLDIISPKRWDSLSCEHSYTERLETQKLISHEMVHVFHGQRNQSPDFNDISGVDWFIEGLAVYASGQCDSIRMSEVKKAISNNNHPQSLGEFWTYMALVLRIGSRNS